MKVMFFFSLLGYWDQCLVIKWWPRILLPWKRWSMQCERIDFCSPHNLIYFVELIQITQVNIDISHYFHTKIIYFSTPTFPRKWKKCKNCYCTLNSLKDHLPVIITSCLLIFQAFEKYSMFTETHIIAGAYGHIF